jgi:hypothetical protein
MAQDTEINDTKLLFTLLIGYAFGRQQRENGNNK